MRPRWWPFAVAALLLLPALPGAAARSATTDALSALDTLSTLRAPDGGYDLGMAPLAVEAAVALGLNPAAWPSSGHSALAALPPPTGALADFVRASHARATAGKGTPQDAAAIQDAFRFGQYGDLARLDDDAWAVRALLALGVPAGDERVQAAAGRLLQQQDPGGGWPAIYAGAPATNVTALVVLALHAANALPRDAAVAAHGFLVDRHDAALGGYSQGVGAAADCDATVWAIRGLHALDDGAPAEAWAFLARLHNADGGYADRPGGPSAPACTAEVAALLGDWAAARRDLSAYRGTGEKVPALTVPVVAVLLGLAARRRSGA